MTACVVNILPRSCPNKATINTNNHLHSVPQVSPCVKLIKKTLLATLKIHTNLCAFLSFCQEIFLGKVKITLPLATKEGIKFWGPKQIKSLTELAQIDCSHSHEYESNCQVFHCSANKIGSVCSPSFCVENLLLSDTK